MQSQKIDEPSIVYNATNVAADFHACDDRVRLLFGAVGCGKSVADCIEVVARGCQQEPGNDGIRHSRWMVVRNTYPELIATTIKTWQQWFPEQHFGKIKWSSPITHKIFIHEFSADIEVIFIALDSENDIKKLMSFELTGAYINELQFIPKSIFDICLQRINRYPAKMMGAPITWTGVIADTNPPDTDHWIYKLFEERCPQHYKIFKFEPALIKVNETPENKHAISLDGSIYINNPAADYREVQNDPDYWLSLVWGYTDEQIKVYLQGEYGTVIDGKPIHPEYNDSLHYSNKILDANPDVEIGLGWDFGLTPACSIVQLMPDGQLVVLDEIYTDDMALRDFAEFLVIPHLDRHYSFWRKNYVSRHDPAGDTGSQTDGKACVQILRELGIRSIAAPSNAPTPRRDAVKYFLRRLVGGKPGYMLSARVKRMRKGMMGMFQYQRIRSGAANNFHDKPLKNIYSHICEAHEYICMHYARVDKKPVIDADNLPYEINRGSFMSM